MQARIQGNAFFLFLIFKIWKRKKACMVKIIRSISTDQLKPLLALHLLPIEQVVFL